MSNANEAQDPPAAENPAPIQAALPVPEMEMEATSFDPFKVFNEHGMIWLQKSHKDHDLVVRGAVGSLGRAYGPDVVDVLAYHKNMHTSLQGQARLQAFRIYGQLAVEKWGGTTNFKDAWYGASKDEICSIVSNGFVCQDGIEGIQLSPLHYPFQSVMSAKEDEKGMRHMIFCRVILGNTKMVPSGTEQLQPSFESGVDSLVEPGRYIIRNAHMNSYILPSYVVSFKLPVQNFHQSPHMKIAALLKVLSKHLHPSQMAKIGRYHNDFLANNITRDELVSSIRLIAGDDLLKNAIKTINAVVSANRRISGERGADMRNM